MKTLFSLLLTTVFFFALTNLIAQKTVKELSELDDKKFEKKIVIDRAGEGYVKTFIKQGQMTPELLPELKKVGLYTFVLFDETYRSKASIYKNEKQAEKMGFLLYRTELSEAGGNHFIQNMYEEAYKGIKAALESKGIALLTPTEYLDTEEKEKLYYNTEVEPTGLVKAFLDFNNYVTEIEGNATPENYVLQIPTFATADVKVSRTMGEIANKLGLDALIAIQVTVSMDNKALYLKNIEMGLYTPNPAPYDPDIKYAGIGATKGYWEGICFGSLGFNRGGKEIEIAEFKNLKVKSEDYDGFELLFKRLTEQMINHFQEEIDDLRS